MGGPSGPEEFPVDTSACGQPVPGVRPRPAVAAARPAWRDRRGWPRRGEVRRLGDVGRALSAGIVPPPKF